MRDIIGPKLGGDPDIYSQWMREGGSGFGFYSNNAKSARRILDELQKQGVSAEDIISPRSWWEALQTINRVVEEAPRLARFKHLLDQGLDVPAATAGAIASARAVGGRVIAVGTTVVRALETAAAATGTVVPRTGWTDLIVTPERGVRTVDGMLTGFHEPKASHLAMLEAIASRDHLAVTYEAALTGGYL
ncbi:MAG: S-adenosylmethionine:tRNA ribosyltransferase-isomerase, partial [Planctomycetes bacterium]|nr:S-adenosylmethionine:tRNA ribosyltransferase-isomerase [Planctomycetota bacterium]